MFAKRIGQWFRPAKPTEPKQEPLQPLTQLLKEVQNTNLTNAVRAAELALSGGLCQECRKRAARLAEWKIELMAQLATLEAVSKKKKTAEASGEVPILTGTL